MGTADWIRIGRSNWLHNFISLRAKYKFVETPKLIHQHVRVDNLKSTTLKFRIGMLFGFRSGRRVDAIPGHSKMLNNRPKEFHDKVSYIIPATNSYNVTNATWQIPLS